MAAVYPERLACQPAEGPESSCDSDFVHGALNGGHHFWLAANHGQVSVVEEQFILRHVPVCPDGYALWQSEK